MATTIPSNSLTGIPTNSAKSPPKPAETLSVLPLTGIPSTPKNALELPKSPQLLSKETLAPAHAGNNHSTPENAQQDRLPDLVTNAPEQNIDQLEVPALDSWNTKQVETFNVDPLSTEDELDAVDALLSLSGNSNDTVDLAAENEALMPIRGANLPLDVAPIPIELGQVDVDHAIAELAAQEEEQSIAEKQASEVVEDQNTDANPKEDTTDKSSPPPPEEKENLKLKLMCSRKRLKQNAPINAESMKPGNLVCKN